MTAAKPKKKMTEQELNQLKKENPGVTFFDDIYKADPDVVRAALELARDKTRHKFMNKTMPKK